MNEQSRLQNSALASLSAHGLLLALYLFLRVADTKTELLLTQVEFLDLHPAAVEEPAPARAPTSVRELIRMALPHAAAVQEPKNPQALPPAPRNELPRLSAPPRLVDRGATLTRSAALPTDAPRAASGAQSQFQDVRSAAPGLPLADIKAAPSKIINIEAVGRARASGGGGIKLEPNAKISRGGSLTDIANAPAAAAAGSFSAPSGKAIDLSESGPRRRGGLPTGDLPVALRSGSGISLSDKPVARPRAAALALEQPVAAPPVARAPLDASAKNKAVEISGPLAHRKTVKTYLPAYPDWARERGVEAEVAIRFYVSAEGEVRDNLLVERTSGYPDLDRLAMETIKKWLFVALPKGSEEADQWGIITFRFRLK